MSVFLWGENIDINPKLLLKISLNGRKKFVIVRTIYESWTQHVSLQEIDGIMHVIYIYMCVCVCVCVRVRVCVCVCQGKQSRWIMTTNPTIKQTSDVTWAWCLKLPPYRFLFKSCSDWQQSEINTLHHWLFVGGPETGGFSSQRVSDGESVSMSRLHHEFDLGPLLLTWFNFNPSMDK